MESRRVAAHTRRRLAFLAAALACTALAGGAPPAVATAPVSPATAPTLAQMVGQRLVVAFSGTTADGWLKGRIRAGQVGGVILFGNNISSAAQLKALCASLQAAATAGHQPRLLISTDQEGGEVRRLSWAPPADSAQQLGASGTTASNQAGAGAGAALRANGINVDLAPVADVPAGSADFIQQQHRAFSTNRYKVALDAAAFASGLEAKGVWPTYKHFPGLGLATKSTDTSQVTINASAATLTNGVFPYQIAIRRHLKPLVMLSTATYPALASSPAAWSPGIIQTFLRQKIGFTGPTITDSLDAAAAVRHRTVTSVSLASARAGADFLLITGSEKESAGVYTSLLAAARAGQLSTSDLNASYHRILAFKTHL